MGLGGPAASWGWEGRRSRSSSAAAAAPSCLQKPTASGVAGMVAVCMSPGCPVGWSGGWVASGPLRSTLGNNNHLSQNGNRMHCMFL